MRKGVVVSFLCLLIYGCGPDAQISSEIPPGNRYATKFSMSKAGNFQLLQVRDPWQQSRGVRLSYVLGENRDALPDSLSGHPFIKIPVERCIAMSTTHLAMLAALDETASLVGLSGGDFVYDPEIRKAMESGLVRDVGYENGLNYELILSLRPDVLFFYGVEGSTSATARKLKDLGIPVVYCAEYLEAHPLGKAEWVRFFSAFYRKEPVAATLFRGVDSAYTTLREKAEHVAGRPAILTGLPWKDTWYVAGGQSFAARLIRDAGGDYLWKDDPSREALALDLESVYARALDADIWINPGVAGDLSELRTFDPRFGELPVLAKGAVFNNNLRLGPGGGNDYWESATLRPDLVLADLMRIFHPDLLPEHALTYYKRLK